MSELPPSARRVVEYAAEHGSTLDVVEYPDGTRSAADAAAAVGCSVDQIVKSMIFDAGGELVLALTSGANMVDGDALAALAGVKKCGRANADQVREHTSFAIGGVPPFGHASPVRTWIDPHLMTFDRIWAAAGTPRHVFPIEPDVLAALAGATVADFAQ